MKVFQRPLIIVGGTLAGLIAIAYFALHTLHATLLDDRRREIHTVLNLAAKQISRYQDLERQGVLSRADAQQRAIEALSGRRDGKSAYI